MQLSIWLTLIAGIVTGIVTSFIIWLFSLFVKRVAIPWYKSLVYEGLSIEGVWHCTYGDLQERCGTIVLNQNGYLIQGEMSIFKHPTGEETNKIFLVRGKFIDKGLVLTYESKDKKRLGSGSIVMTLGNDGTVLKGRCVYINSDDGDINVISELWNRAA